MNQLNNLLLKHRPFHPVIPFDKKNDKLLKLDFTAENEELTYELLADTHEYTTYINDKLRNAGARYGIGGYAEHRTVYSRSQVFDAGKNDAEARRLHLGTDIWGKPNTAVIAPLDGIVHSFAFNDQFGDYGVTIILTHLLERTTFHTLYGHLSLNSIKNISEGDRIAKGDIFAEFGIPIENGHWPPHLHFQIIQDLQGWSGDYPGVCRYSEREAWLSNCPDPELILELEPYIF